MPVLHSTTEVVAGPSSRKRTHAEITRSRSRSQTPPNSKRRRITLTNHSTFTDREDLNTRHNIRPRPMERRRSFRNQSISAPQELSDEDSVYESPPPPQPMPQRQQVPTTIDLTLEDDSPPHRDNREASEDLVHVAMPGRASTSRRINLRDAQTRGQAQHTGTDLTPRETDLANAIERRQPPRRIRAAPPFPPRISPPNAEVIDLLDDDEDETESAGPAETNRTNVPSSPELEFIRENPLPQRPNLRPNVQATPNVNRRLPTPPGGRRILPGIGAFEHLIRESAGALGWGAMGSVFGSFMAPAEARGAAFDPPPVLAPFDGDLEIDLDYGLTGFANVPAHDDDDVQHVLDPSYKAPPAAREGFTRSWAEDEVLVCAMCGDELATGDDELKQQIWAVKACGHVYCGTCASHRNAQRGGNERSRKKSSDPKADRWAICKVEGCTSKLTGKANMFQVYL